MLPPINNKTRLPGELTPRIKRLRKDSKLTRAQVEAIYRLHIDGGVSIRELCRRGWEAWGYASHHSALNSVLDLLRSFDLKPRDRIEATVLASTTHGKGARKDKAAYKRWHRAAFGPWPSDVRRKRAA